MRDSGRIREKIEIALDSRQVVSIVLGAAVALGVVFYLGVTVGRDLAASQPEAKVDRLAELDAQAAELAARLTFPETLTEESPPEPEPVRERGGTRQEQAEPGAPQAKGEAAPGPAAVAPAAKAGAEAAAVGPRAEATPETKTVAAAERPAAGGTTDAAKAESRSVPGTPTDTGPVRFTVQVGAFPTRPEAEAMVSRLRESGLSPYLMEADIPGKGTFYRVRIGRFESRDDAKRYLDNLKRETGLPGFVAQEGG